jgi:hypothetical protein
MNTSEYQYPFAAPIVSIADPLDGLLQTADLAQPIPVDIVVWDAVQPGYYMQLMLDGILAGPIYTFTESDKPGNIVTLKLSEQLLDRDGKYELRFRATSHKSYSSEDSPTTFLEVDRSIPGAALLAPIILPSVTLGEKLTACIAGYADMTIGDFIQTVCNGMKGPGHTVVDDELLHTPINIVFPRDFLQSLGSSNILIEYFITDRAGNVSIMSMPVSLTIQA